MIPSRTSLLGLSREPARAPQPPTAPPRRSAETAREMIGAMRERFGTAPLVDHRATGHLDAEALLGAVPAADIDAIELPMRDTRTLGPGRRTPTSKLRL